MPYKNDEIRKERGRQRQREYRKIAKAFLREYKRAETCAVCGEDEPIALDFHHLDPTQKDMTISRLVRATTTIKKLQIEIEKCMVLCANCHRKVHAGIFKQQVQGELDIQNPKGYL